MSRARVCVLTLTALLGGCAGHAQTDPGILAAAHRPQQRREVAEVPYRADYALYRLPEVAEGDISRADGPVGELWTWRELRRGEVVGFEEGEGGEAVAVAGAEQIPLPPGRYCWRVTPETEYTGLRLAGHRAQETLAAAVAVPCRLAGDLLFCLVMALGTPVR
jgi:hypothetical protein